MLNSNSIAVSNRFVAEGIATHAASQLAARALGAAAEELGINVAFTSSLAIRGGQGLEVIAPQGHQLAESPGFRALGTSGKIQHVHSGTTIVIHEAGQPIDGGPLTWPDPANTDRFMGIPVLRLNAFLETELTRALNADDGATYERNVISAILAGGAMLDRTLELHPYVAERYQDLWEQAQSAQLWPAAA